jgi:hypothetical protein
VLFRSSIKDIDRIIHKASRRDEEMNVLDQSMKYGKIKLYLRGIEFNNYVRAYRRIMDSIYLYNDGLLALEHFLSEYGQEMTNTSRISIISQLEGLVEKLNRIDSRKMTYLEFIEELNDLLKKIENVIFEIRKIYIS